MDIQAGDRVTYKYEGGNNIFELIITSTNDLIAFENNKVKTEILKIERPKYEAIEEKEELLTEEEKEFLKLYIKINKVIEDCKINYIYITSSNFLHINCGAGYEYSIEMGSYMFVNLEREIKYTLSELRFGRVEQVIYKYLKRK